MSITIAISQLKSLGACRAVLDQLKAKYGIYKTYDTPEALSLDVKNCNEIYWAADKLLTLKNRKAYEAATDPLLDAYEAAAQPHWDAYKAATKPLWDAHWDAYKAGTQPCSDAYEASIEPFLDAYEAATKPHWDAYMAACSLEFATLYFEQEQKKHSISNQ